jgi:putative tryptophan/tyrosine transport system substrate-binding protein
MKRREFITLGGGAAMVPMIWPVTLRAQQRAMPLIGFLGSASPMGWENYIAGFHRGLNEVGFVEGRNVKIEYRWAQGNYNQLPVLAAELIGLRATVIVAAGGTNPALAAKAATTSIPIVFTGVGDPVESRVVASLSRPGGNLTGASVLTTMIVAKRFELLSALVPKATVFGILVNPASPTADREVSTAREVAAARRMSLHALKATAENEFDAVFSNFATLGGDALIVSADPFFNSRRDQLIGLAARRAIPTIYGWPEYPNAGGLASYGPDLSDMYRHSGVYAGRILKGEKPSDLPVIQPTKFHFAVNLETAKALRLELPPTVLAIVDEVIE